MMNEMAEYQLRLPNINKLINLAKRVTQYYEKYNTETEVSIKELESQELTQTKRKIKALKKALRGNSGKLTAK